MSSTLSTLTAAQNLASASIPDPDRLAPEDAYYKSPPRRPRQRSPLGLAPGDGIALSARKRREKERGRSTNGRRKANYKKLLWFKQPFPDNYTDEETFLDHLQRNPRLQPYEFWSLMADSTVIVQHIASVAIFCCCFVAIAQDRVPPVSVVSWASLCTVLGWALWDYWMGQEEAEAAKATSSPPGFPPSGYNPPYVDSTSSLSPRNQQRLATAKSGLLIYAAVLGLSPILKSLTRSTTPDSIWAISTWLLCMNVAFFDYGGGTGAHLPASISTNSALMASTVLASRLPSTTHVFSLTLFSIEVFGLFPIFRRQLRSISWHGHLALTIVLVISACGGVFVTLTGGGRAACIAGVILGGILTFFAMGICSWWLIGLQKYKNEIHGPWDPARPVIRRRWD
ncbi:phosphatidylinositol N-acetylglucosaminyltransferas-like protein subunit C [Lindgomyces ingoldianus]|uniref:Phosphatidylinositol N-acetylglucosaminyltransferas-like protein subunit C n=1 Tax=Lindgomyces ingoldianus TaxID=673940 RepID=A0ACB6RDC2_9PLEO|nr:phosphatidylinositol N-acetylglucosaminyltransferas-like protein subunit C [Lindgomyces ingoldianus]KAF2477196.1 phosphatidylinositol N-acetylglucosaminyltransferas-like protein subunit C [Lindgomyces ingoldianus]